MQAPGSVRTPAPVTYRPGVYRLSLVRCLLEAGDVILRDRRRAVRVVGRCRSRIAGVIVAGRSAGVERGTPGRSGAAGRLRELLAGRVWGARLARTVRARGCPRRQGCKYHGDEHQRGAGADESFPHTRILLRRP